MQIKTFLFSALLLVAACANSRAQAQVPSAVAAAGAGPVSMELVKISRGHDFFDWIFRAKRVDIVYRIRNTGAKDVVVFAKSSDETLDSAASWRMLFDKGTLYVRDHPFYCEVEEARGKFKSELRVMAKRIPAGSDMLFTQKYRFPFSIEGKEIALGDVSSINFQTTYYSDFPGKLNSCFEQVDGQTFRVLCTCAYTNRGGEQIISFAVGGDTLRALK